MTSPSPELASFSGARSPESDARTEGVAAFDFDGTLSTRDSFLPYLRIVAGTRDLARAIAAAAPALAASRRDPSQRDVAKAIMLRGTLAGRSEAYLRDVGARYARLVVARRLAPDTVARLEQHRAEGHDIVLVSASLHVYLDPIAELLGADAVLATALEVDADGRCTGEIAGANVRGLEKVYRLDAWLAGRDVVIHAYGDSSGDDELLARAHHGIRVDRKTGMARITLR
jgi:HAD superfamily hydrolase (TIGR01490 family)